jgi:hypothetical protein
VVSASQPRLDLREGGACLSIDDVLAHLDRRLTGTRLEEACAHVDTCGACRIMMAEAARLLAPDGGKRGAPSTLAEGERVGGGRYEIRRFIARGGMGEIYEALDSALGEIVALKTLAITTADQADAARRLLAEVRIARKVVHPNVCRILELGTHHRERSNGEAIPFLTMPLLTGETLGKRLERTGRLPPEQVLRVLLELAAGLKAIHEVGVVHRDFKSDNVFLVPGEDGQEHALVMDFGLARTLETPAGAKRSAGLLFGTPAYMAPEQVEGKSITDLVDVYALGVVAFEMITGRVPFTGESAAAVALARLQRAVVPPSSLVAGVDRRWDAFVRRCMQRRPEDRFATMGEVIAALERVRIDRARRSHHRVVAVVVLGAAAATMTWAIATRPRPSLWGQAPEVRPYDAPPPAALMTMPPRAQALTWQAADRESAQPPRIVRRQRPRTARIAAPSLRASSSPPGPLASPAVPDTGADPFKRPSGLRARQMDDLIDPFSVNREGR